METCGKSFKNDKDEEENDEKNTEEIQSGGNLDGNPLPTARLVHHR